MLVGGKSGLQPHSVCTRLTRSRTLVDLSTEPVWKDGLLTRNPLDGERLQKETKLACLIDDGTKMVLLDLVGPQDVVDRTP
jgi:hypothetical protein